MNLKSVIRNSVLALSLASASLAQAQQLSSVSESKDWTVFVDESNAKHCYVASAPSSTKAMRDGQAVDVTRGDIRLYVGIKNGVPEPSYMAGYPLASDQVVSVSISGKNFDYVTNPSVSNEFAWPLPKFDNDIIAAMKAGSAVEVTGRSQRGTTTVDNFSLSGFTAAYNAAVERCK